MSSFLHCRVALDWLFDSIDLNRRSKSNKLTLADTLTEESFTRCVIFYVCSTLWISRCSIAAISVIFFLIWSESRPCCQKFGLWSPCSENLSVFAERTSSPELIEIWTRSTVSHDQVIQWTKAQVRVCSDSLLCLEKMWAQTDAITRW